MPASIPTDEWVEKLAVHLASEGAFLEYMKNPGDPADVVVPLPWLAMVYLPGRTRFYITFHVSVPMYCMHDAILTRLIELGPDMVEQERSRPQV
jgi:hypothetical protein